ncbi:hypothetical protein [Sinomicrobium sp. M5D2P17]
MHPFIIYFLFCLLPVLLSHSQPVILVKYGDDPEVVKHEVRQYMKYLDIRENIHLTVYYTRHIPSGMQGVTFCQNTYQSNGYRHIIIRIDPRLDAIRRRLVLAHEMIHVKQYAKQELIVLDKDHVIWAGKKHYTHIYNKQAPWEMEAYKADRLLARRFRKEKTAPPPRPYLVRTTRDTGDIALNPQDISYVHSAPLIKSCKIPEK